MFNQCKFFENDLEDDQRHDIFGICHSTDGTLETVDYVICGCCGGTFEMEDVTIVEFYDDWISIVE